MDSWQPSTRYPDPAVQVLDASFERYRVFNATLERLATGFRWGEGPVWFGDSRYLLFSDIPNDRIIRWDEATGQTSVWRQPSSQSNGLTRDRQGRLLACEHLTRRVTRTEYDGRITVLADNYQGKRLNSPNDIVCRSDGSVWFTDPPFGIQGWYEGEKAEPELEHGVYRIDGTSGEVALMTDELAGPNGLCFTPDEKTLYIVESRSTPHRRVWAYEVAGDRLGERRLHIDANGPGAFDGIRCDEEGNLWCGWGTGPELDGVMVFDPRGQPIGHIRLPERCANLCFGGARRNRLFMASSHSLYALHVNVRGAVPY